MSEVHIVLAPTPGLYEARLVLDDDGNPRRTVEDLVGVGHDATRACVDLLEKVGDQVRDRKSETRVSDSAPELDFAGSQVWCWEQENAHHAKIDGIAAAGSGQTKAQAIVCLADVLGGFVKGHAETIAKLRALLAEHGVADPTSVLPGAPTETVAEKNHKLLRGHAKRAGTAKPEGQ